MSRVLSRGIFKRTRLPQRSRDGYEEAWPLCSEPAHARPGLALS